MPCLLSYSGPLLLSGWNHVAIVYSSKQPTLYLNGIWAKTGLTSNQISVFPSALLGGTSYGRYQGEADELRIWSTSRTQSDIRADMCRKLAGDESGLVRYYRFDEETGSVAVDASGNHDGTLSNMNSATDRLISAAPLGDHSLFSYSVSLSSSQTMIGGGGDSLNVQVSAIGTTPSSIHIYRIDNQPTNHTPPGTQTLLSKSVYYGVKVFGGSGVSFSITYGYNGHPGILNPANLQ